MAVVATMVAGRAAEMTSMRRWLHSRPEPSKCEYETTAAIKERLLVEGLEPRVLASGTGLVCDVGSEGLTVALRADIDGLAMTEAKDVPYRSLNPGVCHACGHDVHTAVVLGAGLVLRDLIAAGKARGRVRLIFEPSEEAMPGGALDVISEGWLAGVSGIFGLHCDPKLDALTLGCRVGAITSASDAIDIDLSGPGGHTARPHLTVNLTDVVAQLVRELPAAIQSEVDLALIGDPGYGAAAHSAGSPRGESRMVFGSIHTGSAPNVIPAHAELSGSLRTPDQDVWDAFSAVVPRAIAEILATDQQPSETGFTGRRADGLVWNLRHRRGVPPVVNDARATAFMVRAAQAAGGPWAPVDTPHSWGGDTFGWYLHHVPGCFARLGTHWPDRPLRLDLHRPDFDVDERAIPFGVKILTLTALAWLARNGQIDLPRAAAHPAAGDGGS